MANLIYSIKCVLSSDQINELGLPTGTILGTGKGILEFTTFMVYYGGLLVQLLFQCLIKLIIVMDNFKTQNSHFSNSAMKAFGNHMWYLTEELVSQALFDKGLEDDTQRKLADAIIKCKDLSKSVNIIGLGNLNFS